MQPVLAPSLFMAIKFLLGSLWFEGLNYSHPLTTKIEKWGYLIWLHTYLWEVLFRRYGLEKGVNGSLFWLDRVQFSGGGCFLFWTSVIKFYKNYVNSIELIGFLFYKISKVKLIDWFYQFRHELLEKVVRDKNLSCECKLNDVKIGLIHPECYSQGLNSVLIILNGIIKQFLVDKSFIWEKGYV